MAVNRRHISAREGSAYVDGEKIMDCVKFNVVVTPEVAESKSIGDKSQSRRYIGYTITGTITEYKSKPWIFGKVKNLY